MIVSLDPNILSPFQLIEPWTSLLASLIVTIISIALSLVISWHFFKSYRFSGFGYLLGLPVGFILLAISFGAQHLSLVFQNDLILHPVLFWVQILVQSEGFALIAISYQFKNVEPRNHRYFEMDSSRQWNAPAQVGENRSIMLSILPTSMLALPFIILLSTLALSPYLNYARIADIGFCMTLFNMAIIAYIFRSAVVSLVRTHNVKLLYIPAAYALFFIEQYSLTITYFDNSVIAFVGSLAARIIALSLFVYVTHRVVQISRKMEIEAREKT